MIYKDNRSHSNPAIERIVKLKVENDRLREALEAAVSYVPELKDVPGIKAALKGGEEDTDGDA